MISHEEQYTINIYLENISNNAIHINNLNIKIEKAHIFITRLSQTIHLSSYSALNSVTFKYTN
jgi:hypothetical protein